MDEDVSKNENTKENDTKNTRMQEIPIPHTPIPRPSYPDPAPGPSAAPPTPRRPGYGGMRYGDFLVLCSIVYILFMLLYYYITLREYVGI